MLNNQKGDFQVLFGFKLRNLTKSFGFANPLDQLQERYFEITKFDNRNLINEKSKKILLFFMSHMYLHT